MKHLSEILSPVIPGLSFAADPLVTGICSDSRDVEPGHLLLLDSQDSGAVRGYLQDAFARGAAAVVIDEGVVRSADGVPGPVIALSNLQARVSALAGSWFDHPSRQMRVIGVTGTNGKTTVCWWLEQLFQAAGIPSASIGTLGLHAMGSERMGPDGMTTRDPLRAQQLLSECLDLGVELVAMEVSSHGLAQDRVAAVQFDTAVFTNLSRDHLDYHGDIDTYWRTKKRLFDFAGLAAAVINFDDARGRELCAELRGRLPLIGYSASGHGDADVAVVEWSRQDGILAMIRSPWGEGSVHAPQLVAEHDLSNLITAIAVGGQMGLGFDAMRASVASLVPATGRMQRIGCVKGVDVFVDYAHTPDAVERVVGSLFQAGYEDLTLVLGCGGDRDPGKRPLMAAAATNTGAKLIITSDNPRSESASDIARDMAAGAAAGARLETIEDRAAAIEAALERATPGSAVAILGKGHEAVQITRSGTRPFSDIAVAKALITAAGGRIA